MAPKYSHETVICIPEYSTNWVCFVCIVSEHKSHDDVLKGKHFPRYWPFVWGIHRSPVNSPHKGQWRGALKFSLICAWINGWANNREAGDLRRHCVHYDVIVMNISANEPMLCLGDWRRLQCWLGECKTFNGDVMHGLQGPSLLTWINFNPSMDKWSYAC